MRLNRLKEFPRDRVFSASAPCRIDSGGTWDIKALALPFERIQPTTVNIAIGLRTKVTLSPFDPGWIKVSSTGFREAETVSVENFSLSGPFRAHLATVHHFGIHGVELHIQSTAPVKSALGGSSTALVATIKAISKTLQYFGKPPLPRNRILLLAYHLEDATSGGNCGLQDQAAATYGGVNQWVWSHGTPGKPFIGHQLLDKSGCERLSSRLLVAYSGRTHSSARINQKWIRDFLSNRTMVGWTKVNEIVHEFAKALEREDWEACAQVLSKETSIRREITPEAFSPLTSLLIDLAETNGCGARFSGAGAGGCVWAIGKVSNIEETKKAWEHVLKKNKGAHILECKVDHQGAR